MATKPRVQVTISADGTSYSNAIDKAKGKLLEFSATSKKTSHAAISDVQATSGALRLIDGGITNNIRSAERFLASIKGVGAAMKLIYPGIGLIAVGAVVAKGIASFVELKTKIQEAGKEFDRQSTSMALSQQTANDELAKSNVELQNQINKLEGHPENVIAEELADSALASDKLAESLAGTQKRMQELLKTGSVNLTSLGGLWAWLNGSARTGDTEKAINDQNDAQAGLASDAAFKRSGGDTAGADEDTAHLRRMVGLNLDNINEKIKKAQDKQADWTARKARAEDQTQILKDLEVQRRNLQAQIVNFREEDQNNQEKGQLKIAENAKAAQAAQKKADEDHLRAIQRGLELQKTAAVQAPGESEGNFAQRQRKDAIDYLNSYLGDFHKNSPEYKSIFDEIQKQQQEYNKVDSADGIALQEMLSKQDGLASSGAFAGLASDTDLRAQLKAQQDAAIAQRETAAKIRETSIARQEAYGTLSKYDAAVEMAAVHEEQYQVSLAKLQGQLQAIANDPTLNATQRATKTGEIQSQIGLLGDEHASTTANDQQAISATTALGSLNQALGDLVQRSKDATAWTGDFMAGVSSVNGEIVKLLSTRHNYGVRREFGNIGSGIFKNVAATGLQKAEGSILGLFGIGGKADGSSSGKALWVRMASTVSGAASSVGGSVSNAVGGIGGFLGKIGGFFSGLGFADGGIPPVGMASLVGENGPELFVPHTMGTVIPNHALGGSQTVHIDARGSNDPAATEAAVNRALAKHASSMAAATIAAQKDMAARRPSRMYR